MTLFERHITTSHITVNEEKHHRIKTKNNVKVKIQVKERASPNKKLVHGSPENLQNGSEAAVARRKITFFLSFVRLENAVFGVPSLVGASAQFDRVVYLSHPFEDITAMQ
jgi:hypothetical protein